MKAWRTINATLARTIKDVCFNRDFMIVLTGTIVGLLLIWLTWHIPIKFTSLLDTTIMAFAIAFFCLLHMYNVKVLLPMERSRIERHANQMRQTRSEASTSVSPSRRTSRSGSLSSDEGEDVLSWVFKMLTTTTYVIIVFLAALTGRVTLYSAVSLQDAKVFDWTVILMCVILSYCFVTIVLTIVHVLPGIFIFVENFKLRWRLYWLEVEQADLQEKLELMKQNDMGIAPAPLLYFNIPSDTMDLKFYLDEQERIYLSAPAT